MFMFLARIARLFWEERIYCKSIEGDDFSVTETLKAHQLKVRYLLKISILPESWSISSIN